MEQALVGAGETLRALSRVAIVRSDGDSTSPWSEAQRAVLEGFEQRSF
jgi:hypothetical protein